MTPGADRPTRWIRQVRYDPGRVLVTLDSGYLSVGNAKWTRGMAALGLTDPMGHALLVERLKADPPSYQALGTLFGMSRQRAHQLVRRAGSRLYRLLLAQEASTHV